jgi:hypothetical protein
MMAIYLIFSLSGAGKSFAYNSMDNYGEVEGQYLAKQVFFFHDIWSIYIDTCIPPFAGYPWRWKSRRTWARDFRADQRSGAAERCPLVVLQLEKKRKTDVLPKRVLTHLQKTN